MSVISYSFLIFLTVTILVYYIVPKKIQWIVLLAASLVFYGFAGVQYLGVVIGTAVIVYIFSLILQRHLDEEKKLCEGKDRREARRIKNAEKKKRKKFVVIALILVIAVLALFKLTSFVITNTNSILTHFGLQTIPDWNLIAPLGISFYTFMMIAYLVDIYNSRIDAQKNFIKYLCYVLYFPHVTQGPISRYGEVGKQIFTPHKFDYDKVLKGMWLIIWGFFKKLVIADRASIFVSQVFGDPYSYKGLIYFFAAAVYSVQIYCDFSGCIDICRGASECFGIELAENFIRPYFSQTMPEFWRRWHASLGAFFRDFVFYPVSTSSGLLKLNNKARKLLGNRAGMIISSCVPILTVWVLTGLWHGANWNYICWGVYHGILICLSTIFEEPLKKITAKLKIRTECFSWELYRMLRTFALCMVGRIIFMGKGISSSLHMITVGVSNWKYIYNLAADFDMTDKNWILLLITSVFLLCVSIAQEIMYRKKNNKTIRDWLSEQNLIFRWAVLIVGIVSVLLFGIYGNGVGATFIYEAF